MPDNPSNSPSEEALARAVAKGLENAMMNPDIRDLITKLARGDRDGSSKDGRRGRNVSHAGDQFELRAAKYAGEQANIDKKGGANASNPGGLSASASRGHLGGPALGRPGHEYYVIPPGFGDFAGRPTPQNFANMIAEKNLDRIAQGGSEAQMNQAEARYHRANMYRNEIIPMATTAKQYIQSANRFNKGTLENIRQLGYSQGAGLGGGPGAGDINIGPFGFRNPLNPAFMQGMGIGLHQMKESFGAGINMEQMAKIDATLMGQIGLNFNDKRFRPAEKILEDIARSNPAMDIQTAGQIIGPASRYGTAEDLKSLKNTINDLGRVAKDSNVSLAQLSEQVVQYQQFAGQYGGTTAFSARTAKDLSRQFGGQDPNSIGQFLRNNPFGQQAVMSRGFQSYQIGAMGPGQMGAAFNSALGSSWKQVTGMDLNDPRNRKYLESEQGRKDIATMQNLYGFSQFDAETLKQDIRYAPQRQRADTATKILHDVLRKGGTTRLTAYDKSGTGHHGRAGGHGGPSGQTGEADVIQQTREQLDEQLRAGGFRGKKAEDFIKKYDLLTKDGKMKKGWAERERAGFDQSRHDDSTLPGGSFDKAIRNLKDAASNLQKVKDDQAKTNKGAHD